MTKDFNTLWCSINVWADNTFPQPRHPSGPINHLKLEIKELEDSGFADHAEWADLMILVINGAHCAGLSLHDMLVAVDAKLEKCKKRNYNTVPVDGVIQHDRSGE